MIKQVLALWFINIMAPEPGRFSMEHGAGCLMVIVALPNGSGGRAADLRARRPVAAGSWPPHRAIQQPCMAPPLRVTVQPGSGATCRCIETCSRAPVGQSSSLRLRPAQQPSSVSGDGRPTGRGWHVQPGPAAARGCKPEVQLRYRQRAAAAEGAEPRAGSGIQCACRQQTLRSRCRCKPG